MLWNFVPDIYADESACRRPNYGVSDDVVSPNSQGQRSLLMMLQRLKFILRHKDSFQISMDVERSVQWVHSPCYTNSLFLSVPAKPLAHCSTLSKALDSYAA